MADSILLTGATGAIGPHLLVELLQSPTFERVFVLIRPGVRRDPLERLRETLRRFAAGTGQPSLPLAARRVIPIVGDIRGDNLALDPGVAKDLLQEIVVVVHAAANTRFTAPDDDLYEVNVRGTGRLLELAKRCPRLQQVLLVSTTCVAGTRTGAIAERVANVAPDFVNAYERTKWHAERLAMVTDLPIRIARLSTCIGDGHTGFVHRFGAIHYALHWLRRGLVPMVPGVDGSRVDLIPTDVAARWLARAVARPVERFEVCQVVAGKAAIPLDDLLKFVVDHLRVRDEGWARRQIDAPVVVDALTFKLFERTALRSGDPLFRRVLESVNAFLPSLLYPKAFQTEHADACWGGPLSLGDWRVTLQRVMDFTLGHRCGPRVRTEVTCA
jgi:thioester reductase-like protein